MEDLRKKSTKTVLFVGEDGTELQVVTSISPDALAILKKKGYKRVRPTEAPKKAVPSKSEEPSEEDEAEDEAPAEEDTPTPTRPPRKRTSK